METSNKNQGKRMKVFLVVLFTVLISLSFILADPQYADQVAYGSNETKGAGSSLSVNISGGYISHFNLTATVQNIRWKAFVGHVIGAFTLDDASGSTIYDWNYTSSTGRVYATRQSGSITWSSIACATTPQMESESGLLGLTSNDDNITATFRDNTHAQFPVGSKNIGANTCPTLNTYRNGDKSQGAGQDFEEMVLYDTSSIVYATIVENDATGYNNEKYDFQMIVPENGTIGATGNVIYYMYLELGN